MEEKVYFKNSEGLNLCGILTSSNNETKTCIALCHGMTVDKEEGGIFTNLAKELSLNGFNVFRFDFRGHGESEGKSTDMTVDSEEKDLNTVFEYLKNRGYKTFGVVAASFGGGAASFFVPKHQSIIKALVLWNPLINYHSLVNPTLPWGKEYWGKPAFEKAEKDGFIEVGDRKFRLGKNLLNEVKVLEPWKELLKLSIPVLFVHGDKDTYVPYDDSVKYSKMVKNGKLVTINGAEHGFHDRKEDSDVADKATINFLLKNLET